MIDHIWFNVECWFSIEQRALYSKIIQKLPTSGAHIVEIGTWKGSSTSYMAVEIANSNKSIKFDAIDTFKGSPEHKNHSSIVNNTLFTEYLQHISPVKKYINTIVSESNQVVNKYNNQSLDFVFIDADHSYESVYEDVKLWLPKIKPGGIIAGDDYSEKEFPGVVKAIKDLLGDKHLVNGRVWTYQVPADNQTSDETSQKVKHSFNYLVDSKLDIKQNFDLTVERAYIITLENNVKSQEQTMSCIESCNTVGMPFQLFFGYDGTDLKTIKTPSHLANCDYMKWIKIMDTGLSITEVACALSHLALWAHCITINRPIVILEHDAVMMRKFEKMSTSNSLEFLGHKFEILKFYDEGTGTFDKALFDTTFNRFPMTNIINYNYLFPHGLHAYAIDPIMARRLFALVMSEGLINPIDTTVRVDQFSVIQTGVYAVQKDATDIHSTISVRDGNASTPYSMLGRKYTFNIPGVTD